MNLYIINMFYVMCLMSFVYVYMNEIYMIDPWEMIGSICVKDEYKWEFWLRS